MTRDEHQQRHVKLHAAFDELLADFIRHNPDKRPSTTTIAELMVWSDQQTRAPTSTQHVRQRGVLE